MCPTSRLDRTVIVSLYSVTVLEKLAAQGISDHHPYGVWGNDCRAFVLIWQSFKLTPKKLYWAKPKEYDYSEWRHNCLAKKYTAGRMWFASLCYFRLKPNAFSLVSISFFLTPKKLENVTTVIFETLSSDCMSIAPALTL